MFGSRQSTLDRGLDAFAQKRWKKARELLTNAAEEEPRAIGDYHLGVLLWRGLGGAREVNTAVQLFARAAEQGHAGAQTALAKALRAGVGAPQDLEQAQTLLRSAVAAGDFNAMTELAAMSDWREAQTMLLRAADAGHKPAMRALSDLLLETDPVESLAWLYTYVGLGGDDGARKRCIDMADEMTATEIAAAQKSGRLNLKRLRQTKGR